MRNVTVYENAIVTFIDILGFGAFVLNSTAEETARVIESVEYFTNPHKRFSDADEGAYEPIVHIFSDTIIRIRPVERDDNRRYRIGLLFHELLDIVHIQGELIAHGVILRGAVSFGQIFASETRLFGPALIRAYELEKNCAIYPRVIIDPAVLTEFEQNVLLRSQDNRFEDEFNYIYEMLQEGDDAFWFVDYLRAVESEVDEPELYPRLLLDHRQLIINKACELRLPNGVIQKIMWLARYHNRLINSFIDDFFEQYDLNRNDFLITENDIGTMVNTGTVVNTDDS